MSQFTKAELKLKHRRNDKKIWQAIVAVAQATYEAGPEYGLSDADMEKAICAALNEWTSHTEKLPLPRGGKDNEFF